LFLDFTDLLHKDWGAVGFSATWDNIHCKGLKLA